MKHTICILMIAFTAGQVKAQKWSVVAGSGVTLAKLIPAALSTPSTGTLHYSFTKPANYISPEVRLQLNEHTDACFAYQYTNIAVGTQHRMPGTRITNYDKIDLHGLSLGIRLHKELGSKLEGSVFFKTGFAYATMVAMGASGSGGGMPDNYSTLPVSSGITRNDRFDLVTGVWAPLTTVGIGLSPTKKGWVGNRLSFNIAATMIWNDLYSHHASYDYFIQSGNESESGTVYYRGMPLILQMGLSFRVFDLGAPKARS